MTPLQFARALERSLDYRRAGMSQIEASTQACRTERISDDWAMIIHLTLDASPSLAEDWCERITMNALDRRVSND